MRTENIKKPLHIPLYMMYPKFLFDLRISDTAKLLYVILLDRARMSAASERWTDPDGSVFVCYTVAALSETLHKGKTAIEDGLRSLEQACLIRRKRQGPGMASHIYVKLPAVNPGEAINSCGTMPGETAMPRKTATGNPTIGVPERQAKEGRDPEGLMTGKAATNKNNKNKNDLLKTMSEKRTACGRYKNVFLSDKELQTLQEEREIVEDENTNLKLQIGEMKSGNRKLSEEISRFKMENHSLTEQLEESMQLNEQLLSQNRRLQRQIEDLKNLNSR